MSQNKFMHPRNIYKKPPSFKEMAINYPEFRKFVKPDLSGKMTLDFKDPAALRALTCTLLEKDFELNVDIPLTRLIPTLPLRVNYLLWIEDLLDASGIQKSDYSSVRGIDIGTGASCIYPLLAAKQNNWHMVATEIDAESYEIAQRNVNNNHLAHMITIKLVEGGSLLTDVVHNDELYTFTMCNPPFFSSEEDLDFTSKSRSSSRPPPHNGITGDLKELVAPGGEVSFILKMMEDSKELGSKIRIYTTMVGHKSSLPVLKLELKKLNVTSLTETRFCQGNTTRWGIAWTFDKSLSLQKAYQTPNQKKINAPMSYVVPQNAVEDEKMYRVETITQLVADILAALQIQHTFKNKNKYMAILDIKAYNNTWSHQRLKKRLQGSNHKKSVGSMNTDVHEEDKNNKNLKANCVNMKRHQTDIPDDEICSKKKKEEGSSCSLVSNSMDSESSEIHVKSIPTSDVSNVDNPDGKVQEKNANQNEQKNIIMQVEPTKDTLHVPLLESTLFIRSIASEIHIELLWSGGTGGRESMHQVLQYIKNKLK